jgi:hypothetical protein
VVPDAAGMYLLLLVYKLQLALDFSFLSFGLFCPGREIKSRSI